MKVSSLWFPVVVATFGVGLAATAAGQVRAIAPAQPAAAPAEPDAPETVRLNVAPAGEPRPALKFHLIPQSSERTPGNAAQYYYRALLHLQTFPKEYWKEYADNEKRWLQFDRQSYPKADVARWLSSQQAVLSQAKVATHREYCDWDFRIQDLSGLEPIGFLLHDVQECRQLARVIRLKAHYEIMDGRMADAIETLQMGYQLAHDVAKPPLLINALVGIAIAQQMNEEVVLYMEYGGSNLYWALAALPDPLVDLRPALRQEMNLPYQIFPFLKDAETAERSPDEWRRLLVDCVQNLEQLADGVTKFSDWQAELIATAAAAKMYPVAKRQLIDDGVDAARVEAMPVGQVVAIQTARASDYAYQEMFKIALLPYDEASRRMPDVEKRLIREGYLGPRGALAGRTGLPIASLILPALNAAMQAEARAARNLAALQAIEAIRMHAAANNRQLPQSLADVTIVPVPNNPATGEPFPYRYDAVKGEATLDVPPMGKLPAKHDGKRYVIKLEAE